MAKNFPLIPKIRERLSSEKVAKAIEDLTRSILAKYDFSNENVAIVGIQSRGAILAQRLYENIKKEKNIDFPIGDVNITLYRDDFSTQGITPIVEETHLDFNLDGKKIILVDDVLFTGRTVRAALDQIIDFGRPQNIALAVLIDRGHRELPIAADFAPIKLVTTREESVNLMLNECDGKDEIIICEAMNP